MYDLFYSFTDCLTTTLISTNYWKLLALNSAAVRVLDILCRNDRNVYLVRLSNSSQFLERLAMFRHSARQHTLGMYGNSYEDVP